MNRIENERRLREKVKAIVVQVLELAIEPEELADELPLFDDIDSVAAVEILAEIEDRFSFRFADESLTPQMFDTINDLATAVASEIESSR